uniref:SKP1 component dimerisation domain-containing protein n=1 Tax=Meloidogyne floridensis TaxID=298350 RepID=A0A915P5U2_9BILA
MSQESIADSNENVEMAEEESEENQEPKLYNHVLTEEQKQRKIKCVTWDDKVVEVRESLNLEDAANPEALDNFNFPLNEITEECFVKVVEWLRNHQGLGPIEIKYDHITGERKWFTLTEWEKNFFEIDFEFLKEVYLASNFLDIKSLYYYCAQEAARCIMDKSAQEIRDMLGLPDDLTDEEKAAIAREYEYREEGTTPPPPPQAEVVDESNLVGTSSSFLPQSSSSSSSQVYANVNGSEVTLDFNGESSGNNNDKNEGDKPGTSSS